MSTRFSILGGLDVIHDDKSCTPSPPKVRQLLALLLRSSQLVHIDTVMDELWGDNPPRSATTTMQTYIYQLRKLIVREGLTGSEHHPELLATRVQGYVLQIDPDQLDANTFQQEFRLGRSHYDKGNYVDAEQHLSQALSLWRGPALMDVACGRILEAYATHLNELRTTALELRIQSDFNMGRHRELIGELRSLISENPLNEWFHGKLIEALGRSGRRNDALHAYRELRELLSDELGLDPSHEIRTLHHDLLEA
jgi:DNA-binding SARP family transcriptional activator